MEGTSNKSHKSRLFTSNVLLQKDELEEVGFTFLYSLFEIDGRSYERACEFDTVLFVLVLQFNQLCST